MFNPDTIKEIASIIKGNDNFGICCHYAPDGDAVGSLIALKLALLKMGKKVTAFSPTTFEEPYQPLLLAFSDASIGLPSDEFDVLIFVDCSNIKRVDPDGKYVPHAKKHIINIDHHADNTMFGELNLVNSKTAACAELIYALIKELDCEIDKQIATCLYVALITDSGKFAYPSTTSGTLEIAADLMKKGIDVEELNTFVYEQESIPTIKLLGEGLDRLKSSDDAKIVWTCLTGDIFDRTGASEENADILLEIMKLIKDAKVFLLFRESKNGIVKVSLRSRGGFPVNKIANNFDGGGHVAAAGCRMETTLAEAEKMVLDKIYQELSV